MSSTTITPTVFCGILVGHELEEDIDASTVGRAGPIAGVPLPSEDSAGRTPGLTLAASGAQTSTTVLAIATQRAGNIGTATYRVLPTVSGVARARSSGADLMNVLTGFNGINWSDTTVQRYPHGQTLPDDTQVVAYAQASTPGADWSIRTKTWSPTAQTYASAVAVQTGLDSSHAPWPAELLMPDPQNRNGDPVLLLGYWNADDTNSVANIDLEISRDGGATWSLYASGVLETDISTTGRTLGRFRMAMVGSQIVMFVHTTDGTGTYETVAQYASADAGVTFDSLGTIDDSGAATGYPDVCTVGNVAVLVYSYGVQGRLAVIRNAYVLVTTYTTTIGTVATLTGAGITATIALCALSVMATQSGRAVVHFLDSSAANRYGSAYSFDVATNTATPLFSNGGWWNDGNTTSTDYPVDIASTYYRGQARIYCTMQGATTTYETLLTRLDVGGLTTVTMPSPAKAFGSPVRGNGWEQTYVPTSLPTAYGATPWARTTTGGSDDITTTPGRHRAATVASTRYWTRSPASAPAATTKQVIASWRIWQIAGGSVAAREITVGLRYAFAGTGYEVELWCSATQIRSRDVNAGSTISTASVDVANGIEVLMALSGSGKMSIYYRTIAADGNDDRNYIVLDDQQTCTDDAGAGGTVCVYRYGSPAASTATAEYVPLGQQVHTTYGVDDWATAESNPSTLRGIPYGTSTYALAGVKLTATGGPTLAGDAWTVTPNATYRAANALPVGDAESTLQIQGGHRPSSREAASCWRSTALAGDLVFRFRGSRNRHVMPGFGVHVEGLNVPTYPVYGYNEDSAAYELIGTGTQYKTVQFTRTNANSPHLRCNTGAVSTDEIYVYENDLVGGYFVFPNGDMRPIIANGEGRFSNDAAHGLPYILLDPDSIDGGEDTTGEGQIIFPRSTFFAWLLPTIKYSKYMIRWTTQAPYEGYIKANIIMIGQIHPFPRSRDFGSVRSYTDPSSFVEMRSGLRFGQQNQIAPRLIDTIPMTGAQDQGPLLDATTTGLFSNPFKLSSSASQALAGTLGDTYGKINGIWQRIKGSGNPVVYLPRLAYGTPDTGTLVGCDRVGNYGRMTAVPRWTDRNGRDTGTAHGAIWFGENLVVENEL